MYEIREVKGLLIETHGRTDRQADNIQVVVRQAYLSFVMKLANGKCTIEMKETWKQIQRYATQRIHSLGKHIKHIEYHRLLVVCGFTFHSRMFHSYGEFTILPLTYTRHSWSLSSDGSSACHTYCDTRHPFIMVIFEDLWQSHLLPNVWQWSCLDRGSNPDVPHEYQIHWQRSNIVTNALT